MIGPHEGKELQLMLSGEKPMAMFHDVLPRKGDISEEIIPEQAFMPYVSKGQIVRFSEDILYQKTGDIIRYVCFTLPQEQWRAQFVLWLKREFLAGRLNHSPAHDEVIGRLLGYEEADIRTFLKKAV